MLIYFLFCCRYVVADPSHQLLSTPSIQSQVTYCYMVYFLFKNFFICECQVVEMNNLVYSVCKIITLAVVQFLLFFFYFCKSRAAKSVHIAYKRYTSPRSRTDDYYFNAWVQKCVGNRSEGKNNESNNIFPVTSSKFMRCFDF